MATGSVSFFRPKAITDQKLATLHTLLASLPNPAPDNAGVAVSAYLVALDGVSEEALKQSLAWALQGRHGSLFMPWPTELRKLCDEAEQPFLDEVARLTRQQRLAKEKPPPAATLTLEEAERQRARMRRFHQAHEQAKADLVKQFPKPGPLHPIEYPPCGDINPPDWIDGTPLHVTRALRKALELEAKIEADQIVPRKRKRKQC